MSVGTRLPWTEACDLAQHVAERLAPAAARLKCVGSVRRRRPTVGDIEFLAEPHFDEDLLGGRIPIIEPVRAAMLELGTWVKGGERMMQVTDLLGRVGLKLDLYLIHPPAAWGSLLAIRTGPAELGRYVVTFCRQHGFRHDGGYAQRLDTGDRVPTDTEEQFFELAGLPCLPPHERDALAERVWAEHRTGVGA